MWLMTNSLKSDDDRHNQQEGVYSGACHLDMSVYTGRKSDDDGERVRGV